MESAMILGVSPGILESEFYMIDLPLQIHRKRQQEAQDWLMQLHTFAVPNMEENDRKRFIDGLVEMANDSVHTEDGFDKIALEKLRNRIE
jgi:hypothetical protein